MTAISIELVGTDLVIGDVDTFGTALKAGAIEGVKAATDQLAADVAEHTPVKSGKARDSVVTRITQGGKAGIVRYDYRKREAFYMRFVILGAKAHMIQTKQRTARGIRSMQRRKQKQLEKQGVSAVTAFYESTRYAEQRSHVKRSLVFEIGGEKMFLRHVMHPGIRPNSILKERLDATSSELQETLRASVDKKARIAMQTAARRKSLANRMSPDEWIRAKDWGLI